MKAGRGIDGGKSNSKPARGGRIIRLGGAPGYGGLVAWFGAAQGSGNGSVSICGGAFTAGSPGEAILGVIWGGGRGRGAVNVTSVGSTEKNRSGGAPGSGASRS